MTPLTWAGLLKWQRVGLAGVIEVGPPQRSTRDSASRRSPATTALDLSIVLVDDVSSVSTGQLKWQNDRTGRVSRQPADLRVTGHLHLDRTTRICAFSCRVQLRFIVRRAVLAGLRRFELDGLGGCCSVQLFVFGGGVVRAGCPRRPRRLTRGTKLSAERRNVGRRTHPDNEAIT